VSLLILEGVTGAGKSSTIKALQSIAAFNLIGEETTFDDFMNAFSRDPDTASSLARGRLAAILDEVERADRSRDYLLERFHYSQLALGSDWKWYREIDARCAALEGKVVVLTVPDDLLASRALYRAEYDGADWQQFVPRFGSEDKALGAIRAAQSARIAGVKQSALPFRLLDTSAQAWDRYASEIASYASFRLRENAGDFRT
jgi:thymidylate kinase